MTWMNADGRQPWDRRQDETPKNYQTFLAYRDMGVRRSLRSLSAQLNPKPGYVRVLNEWSSRYDWVDRASAWDVEQEQEFAAEQGEQVRDMRRRHAVWGTIAINKAGEKLRNINPAKLTVREAVMLLDIGVRIERLSRGEASDRIDHTHTELPGPTTAQLLDRIRNSPELLDIADQLETVLEQSGG